jgi:hypothetical protein
VQTKHSSLDHADALLIVENLNRALQVFSGNAAKPQTTLDFYLRSVLTSLRRDLLQRALDRHCTESTEGWDATEATTALRR